MDGDEGRRGRTLVEVGQEHLLAVLRARVADGEGSRRVGREARQHRAVEAGHRCARHARQRRNLVRVVHREFVRHVAHVVRHPHIVLAARNESAEHVEPVGAVHAGERGEMFQQRLARISLGVAGKLRLEAVVVGVAVLGGQRHCQCVVAVGTAVRRELHLDVLEGTGRERALGREGLGFAAVEAVGQLRQRCFGEAIVGHAHLGAGLLADEAELRFEGAALDGQVVGGEFAFHLNFGLEGERLVAQLVGVHPVRAVVDVAAVGVGLSVGEQSLARRQFAGVVDHEVLACDFERFGQHGLVPARLGRRQVDGLDECRRSERLAERHVPARHALGSTHADFRELSALERLHARGGQHDGRAEAHFQAGVEREVGGLVRNLLGAIAEADGSLCRQCLYETGQEHCGEGAKRMNHIVADRYVYYWYG